MGTALLLIFGFVLLVAGAELLVRGASHLAITVGISPLVVGLTVVAFGTGAPELAVTMKSTWEGNSGIAIGNVVGSNIANILLVLGVASLISPLPVARSLLRRDLPILIITSFLFFLFALDGKIDRLDGTVFFVAAILYTGLTIYVSRLQTQRLKEIGALAETGPSTEKTTSLMVFKNLASITIGIAILVLGANFLVQAAVMIAALFGVSQLVIGLTIVAIGTSLPEVATSLIAGVRESHDLAVGNAVGSNLVNILFVLGSCAIVAPGGIPVAPDAIYTNLPIMILTALACLPIFYTGYQIERRDGAMLLMFYAAYLVFLCLKATGHAWSGPFTTAMTYGILPAAVLWLVIRTIHDYRSKERGTSP